ncbi:MAG: saccharopine dehydrogenase, partial [Lachnospiraceae bacterium]|nr:saccharopine dehydrogenase [Lachnospiraceae bacterium]
MRMMLVGAGAVGESILKILQWRDPSHTWFSYALLCDQSIERAGQVIGMLSEQESGDCSCYEA